MTSRKYHSTRTGHSPKTVLTLDELKIIANGIFKEYFGKGYFGYAFGFNGSPRSINGTICTYSDDECMKHFIYRKLRKKDLWPIEDKIMGYSEDDLFDIIELFYDHVSRPYIYTKRSDIMEIGLMSGFIKTPEYLDFDKEGGKREFREEVNKALNDYNEGFNLSIDGEIQLIGEKDLQLIFSEIKPSIGDIALDRKIENAILKFRHHSSTDDQKKDAVRELADVLESLKSTLRKLPLSKDTSDLFNIANNFGIRHFNPKQKTDYDNPIFLTWIFSSYLSTIYLILRLKKR